MISIEIPASFGLPGPGDITRKSGARAFASSMVMASFLKTTTSVPKDLNP